jgi:GT2 family glycosyltransferase
MGLARRSSVNAKNLDELVLSASLQADKPIVHVPHVLCHAASRADCRHSRLTSVARHLKPVGATCAPGPFGTIKVEWPLPPELPLVTIIIPTKDKLELLRPCVETVLGRTSYANFELLIIDNASVEQRTADYLAEAERNPRVRVLTYAKPYNFSAINNFAAEHGHGSHLCLLNNDTEVIEGNWLTEMMRYAVRPEVGAVGAKLLYDDGSLQHAGVIIGIGDAAGHAHRFLPPGDPGYFRQPHIAQFVSAVTAACLVIDKSKFQAVGGFDAAALAVAFNDVDFCLKLEAKGWRNVYVPHAVLLHHESKSRGNDTSRANIDRYRKELGVLQARWGTRTYSDPLLNPNLDRYSETFVIDF